MKRFILLLGFLLLSADFVTPQHQPQSKSKNYIDWIIQNPNDWGSFYWSVTQNWDGKMNVYQVYLFSNSYFQTKHDGVNYDRATTYIRNLTVTMVEIDSYGRAYNTIPIKVAVANADYVLGRPVAVFWSQSNRNGFQITYEVVSPFDYSKY